MYIAGESRIKLKTILHFQVYRSMRFTAEVLSILDDESDLRPLLNREALGIEPHHIGIHKQDNIDT